MSSKINQVRGSKHDIDEAVNHIRVANHLQEMANSEEIDENFVRHLHAMVMEGLLSEEDEGLPGEYRKVSIGVHGSQVSRALAFDVPPMMAKWCKSLEQQKDELIVDYLTRIHTNFQYIHPFIDGNGRIGHLVMNLILLKRGYPVLVFPNNLSNMFNHGVEMCHRGSTDIFSRLLAESLFTSLQLPRIEDISDQEVAMNVIFPFRS